MSRGRLAQDLTGQRFERLLVLDRAPDYIDRQNGKRVVMWRCRCDCGEIVEVMGHNLRDGKTKSCGCLRRETSRSNMTIARAMRRYAG